LDNTLHNCDVISTCSVCILSTDVLYYLMYAYLPWWIIQVPHNCSYNSIHKSVITHLCRLQTFRVQKYWFSDKLWVFYETCKQSFGTLDTRTCYTHWQKSWENHEKKTENNRQFWQKYSHFEKIGDNFLSLSYNCLMTFVSAAIKRWNE